ncbi:MAG: magnesium protoporphyrin IX methyltransferase [Pseudomonadota bacterium]
MAADTSYTSRRDELQTYFDQTATQAWQRLTSDAPVSGIRATVRAGRDGMRAQLLSWLPDDLHGARVLDAGCGTGAMAIALAERGAQVVAIDIAGSLVDVARERTPDALMPRITYGVGDMLAPALGRFDAVVAMDSLIHYPARQIANVLAQLATRTTTRMLFTYAPATFALRAMHTAGRLFPRADRAPAIMPVATGRLRWRMNEAGLLDAWAIGRDGQIQSGFYTSHAMEVVKR